MSAISFKPTSSASALPLSVKYEELAKKLGPSQFEHYCLKFPFIARDAKTAFGPYPTWRYETLATTLERKVIVLTQLYFNEKYLNACAKPTEKDLHDIAHHPDMYAAFKQCPGFKVIRDSIEDVSKQCDWYVFQDEAWFKEIFADEAASLILTNLLFTTEALKNLVEQKGYERIWKPEEGAVIVYFDKDGKACHYGKVVAVSPAEITIESSFYHYFIARHPQASVPSMYGTQFAYIRKKNGSN